MKEEGKKHARQELAALKRGKASKAVVASERAEYGMKNGGPVKRMKSGGMVKGKK
jgi:hypothetical protein